MDKTFYESKTIIKYGYRIQQDLSKLSDRAMRVIVNSDLESVSHLMEGILLKMERYTAEEKTTILDKIWPRRSSPVTIREHYDEIEKMIDELQNILNNQKLKLRVSTASYEACIEECRQCIEQLEELLDDGRKRIAEASADVLPAMIDLFEERLLSLGITKTAGYQLIEQLEQVKRASISMINKLNDMLKIVIPLWKRSLIAVHGMEKLNAQTKELADIREGVNRSKEIQGEMLQLRNVVNEIHHIE